MAELTKEKDELDKKISTYKVLFESRSQLLNEMQGFDFSLLLCTCVTHDLSMVG